MNLSLIEAFNAVMRTGSTTRGAELMGVSQPAISRSLKRLEDVTKLKLFERAGPRLIPTPEANLLYQEILDTYVGMDRLKQAVARIRAVGTGSLRITTSAALGLSLVPRVIKLFTDRHPGVTVTFEIANSSIVRNLVASGTHDIGLCADEIDTTNVMAQPFIATRGICVMPYDHPLGALDTVTPIDLDGVPLVSLSPDDTARKQLDAALRAAGSQPKIVVETQFAASVCQLVAEGVGVGLTNAMAFVASEFENRGLMARTFEPSIAFRALVIQPPQRARSRLLDDLLKILDAERDTLQKACETRFGSV
ncbi:MAG: LysR family transcriptional regulator [Sphingomonadales bacterium 28-55-16]|nr:MAG: LysR family transcriptional regulator [Sphingomonadales bacterium 28-55-16]